MSVTIGEQSQQLKAAAVDHLPPDILEVFDRSIEDFLREGVPAAPLPQATPSKRSPWTTPVGIG